MNVLLLGGSGQLGTEIRHLPPASDLEIVAPDHDELDLVSETQIVAWLAASRWDAVINAAAYTDVDRAEAEPTSAFAINATAPARLAAAANHLGIPVIHVSTDYVFDGLKGRPYEPSDLVNPINVYGASKAMGERNVCASNRRHVILRTSWLYSPFRKNFMKTMLRLGMVRDRLAVVEDQRGCPTAAQDLAKACVTIARRIAMNPDDAPYGAYHFTGAGEATWYTFARTIFDLSKPRLPRPPVVDAIMTTDYPTAARRPVDSRLDCASAVETWGVVLRDWRVALEDTLARYAAEVPA
jgi:dTDP-4-dehydrorhamnose reductase